MAYREEQVVIIARVHHIVRVRPVGEVHGMTVDVEMIEGVPHPVWIAVRIHIDNRIANHRSGSRITREIGVALVVSRQHYPVAIGQCYYSMMKTLERVDMPVAVAKA